MPRTTSRCARSRTSLIEERRPRREIVALVAAADACLIPHARTPMTEAMSPLKLYEYLAGGAPVAAVDLPGIAGVDAGVQLVEPGADIAGAVERALARGRAPERQRRETIAAFAWERRIDARARPCAARRAGRAMRVSGTRRGAPTIDR